MPANLIELGLRPGERIASLMPNRTALLLHYLACTKAGFVAVPLNYRYMAPEIDHALEVSGASALFVHAERMTDVEACEHAGQLSLGLITYGGKESGSASFEAFVDRDRPDVRLAPPEPSAPAFIFFTSGSTGPAKGVTHSLASIGWNLATIASAFEMTSDDVVLPGSSMSPHGWLPFFFRCPLRRGPRGGCTKLRCRRDPAASAVRIGPPYSACCPLRCSGWYVIAPPTARISRP